ncbi:hypothetical protein [Acidovorax sp. Root219]|uniref:hypothetical protein n=1 Tax=Acidovorax sp. Root219 TaxID=1736493 RepID=UPI000708FDFC|nr:hypothetical protein [Acidovorax sp. Root219]KRC36260.1 hypothetical protein ASE28_01640 [Acidovorax sp. Root219]
MHAVDAICTVTLRDYPEGLPAQARHAAEAIYVKELGRTLGAVSRIGPALDAVVALEFTNAPISDEELALIRQWDYAAMAARQAALQYLGEARGCHFDVQRLHF